MPKKLFDLEAIIDRFFDEPWLVVWLLGDF